MSWETRAFRPKTSVGVLVFVSQFARYSYCSPHIPPVKPNVDNSTPTAILLFQFIQSLCPTPDDSFNGAYDGFFLFSSGELFDDTNRITHGPQSSIAVD